ncbi:IS3 family transposase [Hymenobacter sp. UYCo722]|uniref:IS3 family transposase n=1 Tax=Hymenobacter sp. UYCo722 TaxID=3156335 RepID=UPI0033999027
MSRYAFIAACTEPWPVQVLCRLLAVSSAGYYQWRQRPTPLVAPWQPAAQAVFTRHARRYGTRRLRAELRAEGHAVGRYALRTWLHRNGLRALSTRPQRPRTTVPDQAAVVAENRLLGQPVHHRRLPRPHRPSGCRAQLQPTQQSLRQRPGRSRL